MMNIWTGRLVGIRDGQHMGGNEWGSNNLANQKLNLYIVCQLISIGANMEPCSQICMGANPVTPQS